MSVSSGIISRVSGVIGVLGLSVIARAECHLEMLAPQGSEVRSAALIIKLGDADNPVAPTAWQGPLVAGDCTFELGIIEQPLALASDRWLYVSTYSGSIRRLTLLDLRTCSIRWKSTAFSGALNINPKALDLGERHVPLNGQCLPIEPVR